MSVVGDTVRKRMATVSLKMERTGGRMDGGRLFECRELRLSSQDKNLPVRNL